MTGRGTAISWSGDRFLFGSSKLIGDGEIIVRVASLEGSGNSAMAGLHMRSSLSRNEPSASIMLRSNGNAEFMVRPNWRQNSYRSHAESNVSAPYYLRLVRVGNDFSGFISEDASNWTEVARWVSVMPPAIDVGLAVLSGSNSESATATFDNFQFNQYNSHGLKGLWRFNDSPSDHAKDESVYGQDSEVTDVTATFDPERGPVMSFNGGVSFTHALELPSSVVRITHLQVGTRRASLARVSSQKRMTAVTLLTPSVYERSLSSSARQTQLITCCLLAV